MRFLSYLVTLLVASLIASCGGGGGSPGTTANGGSQAFFTTAPANLTLPLNTPDSLQHFTVSGGKGPFTASSNNTAVAVASIDDKTLTLGGVSPGLATITLRDALGASTSVAVTVQPNRALFSTAPASITVPVGVAAAQTFQVGGGVGPYSVASSNTGVVSAVLTGTALTITGLAAGAANVQILDAVGGTTTISVTVPAVAATPLFTTAPGSVTFVVGSANAQTFSIGGGAAPYIATSSNTRVAAVDQATPNTVKITGLLAGTANVVIRDGAGATISITVTVSAGQLTLNPTTVSAFIGDTVFSSISGATGAVTTVSGFPDAAQVDVGTVDSAGAFTANASGNVLRIRVKQTVASNVIVVRDASGSSASFTLTASAGTNEISLSPKTLTMSGANPTASVTLTLFGASTTAAGAVNLFSSDPGLLSVTTPVVASIGGTPVTVTKPAGCFGGTVVITAIDSIGAKAEATITLVTPAAGCGP